MIDLFFAALALLSTLPCTYGHVPSAGDCGTKTVSTVPGCFGVPGCAYVVAAQQSLAAACKYNYCDCGGTPAPLLPSTIAGTSTLGCGYTIQPTTSKCPTASQTVPSLESSSKTETLTAPGHGLITLTLPFGSAITGLTTLTTKGSTLTLSPTSSAGSKSKAGPSHTHLKTTATTRTQVTSAASATRSPAVTPPPPGSPGFIATAIPSRGSKQRQVAITLDSGSYVLPHTVSVELLQTDGSFITLFSDSIVSGTSTVSVSQLSTPTILSLGDLSIHARPEPAGSPHTGGASGFDGLINALESLAGEANAIVNTLDQIGSKGVLWSAGSLSTSSFASEVGPLLDGVTGDLSDFVSTISSTLDTYEAEVYQMTEDGLVRVFPARTGAVEEFDLLSALRKLLRHFRGLKRRTLTLAKTYWKPAAVVGLGGALAAAEEKLRSFGAYDWGSERKKHTTTIIPTTTTTTKSTLKMSKTTESTSSSSAPPDTPTLHFFETNDGTDVSVFKSYIKTLPDKGEGAIAIYRNIGIQMYQTELTAAQAKEVAAQPFVRFCYPVFTIESEGFGAIPLSPSLEKRINTNDLNLQERTNSDDHLRIISQKRNAVLDDYLFDPSLGEGSTIYILDAGFNIKHEEFGGDDRTVETYVVPNQFTLANEPDQSIWPPEDIYDIDGHGTMVASVAAGVKHGVASKANLFLIKFKGATKNIYKPNDPTLRARMTTASAMNDAWRKVIDDVTEKRGQGKTGKFVVNMSYGFSPHVIGSRDLFNALDNILDVNLKRCWNLDIITVTATGNSGSSEILAEATPQRLGTATNGLITVGGVEKLGFLDKETTVDDGNGGSISVYAVSQGVIGADYQDKAGSRTASGTSLAAPAVAGLAAYFAALSSLENQWRQGSVATDMKDYIRRYAYVRNAGPLSLLPVSYKPLPAADSIIVAYNRAPDGLCSAHLPSKRALQVRQASSLTKRDYSSGDVPVVVSGTIVVSSLSQSYCSNTRLPTRPPATTTAATTTAAKTASPSPTVSADEGILTCGTRTDQGNAKHWFSLSDAQQAVIEFCHNMTRTASPPVYKEGTDTNKAAVWIPPDNVNGPIWLSAKWDPDGDSRCPTTDFSINRDLAAYRLCKERLLLPVNDCDTQKHGHNFWKQGGKFHKACITWWIAGNATLG